ncbi:hypothetical protein IMCC3317_25490 [Kordia antarctica]|uniref:Dockerin domain-containing protein n=1 Tax=Kordia antarctica TaxID=1218801 RepID=A0A7L4ZKX9_9FLAO|nr:hypothetical protein [Kordia antarctica]QHI37171.1 hypothetical protein IMCC3317_25490 [Kordia antarctica]
MKYTKWIFPLFFIALFMTSCSHEENEGLDESNSITEQLLKNYPKEITIDNWELFVEAPKEVIDHFVAQEAKEMARNEIVEKRSLNTSIIPGLEFGQIQVQTKGVDPNTAWLGNTFVTITRFGESLPAATGTSVNYNILNNNNYVIGDEEGTMCFYYESVTDGEFTNTHWRNGISTLDIVFISRHLIGLECFTEIWQYLAADVNGDGTISTLDMIELQNLILYITNELPLIANNTYNQPVIYFPQNDYKGMQEIRDMDGCNGFQESTLFGFYSGITCQSNANGEIDRFAIKRGDVSGNWVFN